MWLLVLFACPRAGARAATLSNERLPLDSSGQPLITGEASVLAHDGTFFLYTNDWGSCPGVDCCASSGGCASCCFDDPPQPFTPGCESHINGSDPYGSYHIVRAYRTDDFSTWTDLGVALSLSGRPQGIMFRPQVIYSPALGKFVMWYEDRTCPSRRCGSRPNLRGV